MKFCPVVSKICCEHVHVARKERRRIIIIIKIRNGAKTMFGRLKYHVELLFGQLFVANLLNNLELTRSYFNILRSTNILKISIFLLW